MTLAPRAAREPEALAAYARTPARALLAVAPIVAWTGFGLARGEWRRWELWALLLVAPLLALGGARARRLLAALYPLGLVAVLYDAMRLVRGVGLRTGRVHDCDLRALDARLFGWRTGDGALATAHDWFQAHHTTALDLACAVPYGSFIAATIVFAVFLYRVDPRAATRFAWSFFVVNVAGLATHHAFPAAPPWYFHAHGCAVDLGSPASAGPRLLHVDAVLGVGFFRGFYARSQDVFGALPSLHVAYPMLIARFGWRHFTRPWRAASGAFLVAMCFAAVYLDHHWILDVLAGLGYAWLAARLVTAASGRVPLARAATA